MSNHFRYGFTLIELLVVIAIIMLLVTVAGVSFGSSLDASRNTKRRGDLEMVRAALEMWRGQDSNKKYPTPSGSTDDVKFNNLITTLSGTAKLLTNTSVQDPLNSSIFKYYYDTNTTFTSYQVCAVLESTTLPSGCNSGSLVSVTLTDAANQKLCCLNSP